MRWARHPVNRNRNRNRFFVPHPKIRTGKQDRTENSRKSYRNTGQDFFYRNRTCKQGSIQDFISNKILHLFSLYGVFLLSFQFYGFLWGIYQSLWYNRIHSQVLIIINRFLQVLIRIPMKVSQLQHSMEFSCRFLSDFYGYLFGLICL